MPRTSHRQPRLKSRTKAIKPSVEVGQEDFHQQDVRWMDGWWRSGAASCTLPAKQKQASSTQIIAWRRLRTDCRAGSWVWAAKIRKDSASASCNPAIMQGRSPMSTARWFEELWRWVIKSEEDARGTLFFSHDLAARSEGQGRESVLRHADLLTGYFIGFEKIVQKMRSLGRNERAVFAW